MKTVTNSLVSLHEIQPGDYIRVKRAPYTEILFRVKSGPCDYGGLMSFRLVSADVSSLTVHIPVGNLEQRGWLFIGRSQQPVEFTHEPNLESRLRRSLRAVRAQKGKGKH